MADRNDKDWRNDHISRIATGCYSDDVEGEEDDYDDDDYVDEYLDEENDDDVDDAKIGLACPFCLENFDALGLCCHIDLEHHREARAAICPVCASKVDTNIVSHLITQHGTILKMLCKRKIHKRGYFSDLLIFKKELQDEQFHSQLKESTSFKSSSCTDSKAPFLSFASNSQPLQKPETTTPALETGSSCNSDTNTVESAKNKDSETCILRSSEDQERVQRCEFVSQLLLSTIFDSDF